MVSDAQDCEKDVWNGYQHKKSEHLKQDEAQCKTEETNTLRIELSSYTCFEKLLKIQPEGVQMASQNHSGGDLGGHAEEKPFFNASTTPQGPLLGSHLGIQKRSEPVPEVFPRRT